MIGRLRSLSAAFAGVPRYIYKNFGFLLWITIASGVSVVVGEMLINKIYFKEFGLAFASGSAAFGNIVILSCFLVVALALINRLFPAITIGLGSEPIPKIGTCYSRQFLIQPWARVKGGVFAAGFLHAKGILENRTTPSDRC
jgi:hypothetical protein